MNTIRRNAILAALASSIWGEAWRSWYERIESAGEGDEVDEVDREKHGECESFDVPDVPEDAADMASAFLAKLAHENDLDEEALVDRIYNVASRGGGHNWATLNILCWRLVGEAVGHGLTFEDDFWPHGLKVPLITLSAWWSGDGGEWGVEMS